MSAHPDIETRDAALIAEVLDALREDAGLQALLGTPARVFDDETRSAIYPFIVLERCERNDSSASGRRGAEHRLQFASASRDGGQQQAKLILSTLRAALERMDLLLEHQSIVLVHPTYSDVMHAPNRQVLRGVLRVRIHTEEY